MDGHVEVILNRGIMDGFLYGAKITSQSRSRREIQKIFLNCHHVRLWSLEGHSPRRVKTKALCQSRNGLVVTQEMTAVLCVRRVPNIG